MAARPDSAAPPPPGPRRKTAISVQTRQGGSQDVCGGVQAVRRGGDGLGCGVSFLQGASTLDPPHYKIIPVFWVRCQVWVRPRAHPTRTEHWDLAGGEHSTLYTAHTAHLAYCAVYTHCVQHPYRGTHTEEERPNFSAKPRVLFKFGDRQGRTRPRVTRVGTASRTPCWCPACYCHPSIP